MTMQGKVPSLLEAGGIIRIAGWRGVYRLTKVRDAEGEVDVWGPLGGARQGMRSAAASRVARARRADVVRFTP